MIEVRPGTEADRPQVLARIAEVFGPDQAARAARRWDWQWHLDPRLPTPGYRGIVAAWQGQIIGTLATIPAGLHVAGAPVAAQWIVDALVHPGLLRQALKDQRGRGGRTREGGPDLSRGLAAALLDHPAAGPIQLGKHISDPMMAVIERLGFRPVTGSGSRHRRVSTRHTLGRGLGRPLGGLVGAIADLGLGPVPSPALPVGPHSGPFDSRFDRLWEEVKALYPAICRRDSATLEWRYRQGPDANYRVLTAAEGERLRGYIVLLAYRREQRRRAKIVDLLTRPGDAEAIRSLVSAALGALRDWRAERVEVFACGTGIAPLLADLGFRPRLTKSDRPQPLMARALPPEAAGIYVTQGDGDGG